MKNYFIFLCVATSLIQISQCVNLRSQTELETQSTKVAGAVNSLVPGQKYCIVNAYWNQYLTVMNEYGSSHYNSIYGQAECQRVWIVIENTDGSYGLENVSPYGGTLGSQDVWLSVTSTNANTVRGVFSPPGSWERLNITSVNGGPNFCIYGIANNRYVSMSQDGSSYPLSLQTWCYAWENWNFIPATIQVSTVLAGETYCIFNPFWGNYLGEDSTYTVQGFTDCRDQWIVGDNSDGTFYLKDTSYSQYLSISATDKTTVASSVGPSGSLTLTGSGNVTSIDICIHGVAANLYASMYPDGSAYFVDTQTYCGPYEQWYFFIPYFS